MKMWLSGRLTKSEPDFDGTFRTLLGIYQIAPESSFHELAHSSRYPYNFYLPMLIEEIGARRIEDCDGKDAKRWFKAWGGFDDESGTYGKHAKALMCIAVIKAALKFGIICKYKGCADFKAILTECDFPGMRRRKHAPTADQIIAARKAAHARGDAPLALAYAIQFEGTNRQTDVMGQWVPLSERAASAVIDGTEKWIGPTWKHVDQNLVLRFTPSKTARTTAVEVVIDFKSCPMVMEELQRIPVGGPARPADRQPENRPALQVQGASGPVAARHQAQRRNAIRNRHCGRGRYPAGDLEPGSPRRRHQRGATGSGAAGRRSQGRRTRP